MGNSEGSGKDNAKTGNAQYDFLSNYKGINYSFQGANEGRQGEFPNGKSEGILHWDIEQHFCLGKKGCW